MRNAVSTLLLGASFCGAALADISGGQDRPLRPLDHEASLSASRTVGGQDRNVNQGGRWLSSDEYVANSGQDRNVNSVPMSSEAAVCQKQIQDLSPASASC